MLHKIKVDRSFKVYKKKKNFVLILFRKKILIKLEDNILINLKKKERLLHIKFLELSLLSTKESIFKKILIKCISQINKIEEAVFSLKKVQKNIAFLIGLGYKFELSKNIIFLKLGFSHNIKIVIPIEIQVYCSKETILLFKSSSKEKLQNFIHTLQKYKKPEDYKNKGICLNWEILRSKKITKSS